MITMHDHQPCRFPLFSIMALCVALLFLVAWRYQDLPMHECAWCHRSRVFVGLNRHHYTPQSVDPARRDDPTNLVVLCRKCHYCLAHRCNWRTYNPDAETIINAYTNTLPCSME